MPNNNPSNEKTPINRTQYPTGAELPLESKPEDGDTTEASAETTEPTPEVTIPETEQETEQQSDSTDDKPEVDEYTTKVVESLDSVLNERAGVDLNGVIEALTELLQWRNDILAMGLSPEPEQLDTALPGRVPRTGTVQRSTGRNPVPTGRSNFDYSLSQINSMSTKEYESQRESIHKAFLSGRVLKD
jgi:hypothetical protein